MADLPAPKTKSSDLSEGQLRLRMRVVDLMVEGKTLPEIAKQLGRGDKKGCNTLAYKASALGPHKIPYFRKSWALPRMACSKKDYCRLWLA